MGRSDPAYDAAPMDRQLYNQLFEYLEGEPKRQEAAERRNRELIRAHEAGWKLVAGALERGLGQIAAAIRDYGR